MSTLLLYPPITDPTSGYHSLVYLETYARQQGFHNIEIVDTNIEGFLYSLRSEEIEKFRSYLSERLNDLESRPSLHAAEQIELSMVWRASALDPEEVVRAVETLRDPEAFYDYKRYHPAVERVVSWLDALSVLGFPGQFENFTLNARTWFNVSSVEDMSDAALTARIAAPFAPYLHEVLLPMIAEKEFTTVGINITYVAQLPFALAIGRLIRERFPDMVILFGGTEVADVWKYLTDRNDFFRLFDCADACVIGEGELAFSALLKAIEEGGAFRSIPNVHYHPKHGVTDELPVIQYIDISNLPTPDYSKLNWDLYLSPEPFVYYSPSRGCYWNRCTFCDYGLNENSPTSPWRHNPLDKFVEDLRVISQNYRFVYFSVDVLSPATLLHLSERLIEEGIDIRWGAEIRLEKYWSIERCQMLKQAGCVAISVGFESGNQRILNLIDKGTQVQRVEEVIHNFHAANIAVQIMGFTGFPTETFDEAMESVEFLARTRDKWSFGGLGTFSLTPGAIAAKEPERFQIVNVRPYEGEEIKRQLYYEDPTGNQTPEQAAALEESKQRLRTYHFGRPWVGGVDAAHSFFYHDVYQVNILQEFVEAQEVDLDQMLTLNGRILPAPSGYPLEKLNQPPQLTLFRRNIRNNEGRGVTFREISSALEQRILERTAVAPTRHLVGSDLKVHTFSDAVYHFLQFFTHGNTMRNFLATLPEEEHSLYLRLLKQSTNRHFLVMNQPTPERVSLY